MAYKPPTAAIPITGTYAAMLFSVSESPTMKTPARRLARFINPFENMARCCCCIGSGFGEVSFYIYPSNHIYVIKSNVYRMGECRGEGLGQRVKMWRGCPRCVGCGGPAADVHV